MDSKAPSEVAIGMLEDNPGKSSKRKENLLINPKIIDNYGALDDSAMMITQNDF